MSGEPQMPRMTRINTAGRNYPSNPGNPWFKSFVNIREIRV